MNTGDIAHLMDTDGVTALGDYSAVVPVSPIAVVSPRNHADCVAIVQWANREGVSLVCRAGGTGTTGGALPITANTVVVTMRHMNRVIAMDESAATITVEPGVILAHIHDYVEGVGLFYPPDPASLAICTIGGNVMENAGGPRALKYGVTRNYVLGLKGVWGSGESFAYGGQCRKNVAGYDMIGLLTGSEGTLGIITEITLALRPKPRVIREMIVGYASSDDAVAALRNGMQQGVMPSTAEFMVDDCVAASLAYLGVSALFERHPAYVSWQVDGFTEADVEAQLARIVASSNYAGCMPMDTPERSEHVWSIRRSVSLGFTKMAGKKYSEDIVVPVSQLSATMLALADLAHESGIRVVGYGHLGDGNIHVNILKMGASDADWDRYAPDVVTSVMALAMRYGGSLSGEHGIGVTKKPYMGMQFTSNDLRVFAGIKSVVDPQGIMNPHKAIYDNDYKLR